MGEGIINVKLEYKGRECDMCHEEKPDVRVYLFLGGADLCEACAERFEAIWFGD